MKSIRRSLLILCFIMMPSGAGAEEIKLYLDNSRTGFIMVEKQDCSVYRTEDGRITLGFKAGSLFFGVGPEISFGTKSGIDWDHMTQRVVARYLELCARFNTGSITKEEYDRRVAEIEEIEKDAYELYQSYLKEKAKRRDTMFDELDKEMKDSNSLRKAYDRINRKIDRSSFPE